jgi:hypothetical protein
VDAQTLHFALLSWALLQASFFAPSLALCVGRTMALFLFFVTSPTRFCICIALLSSLLLLLSLCWALMLGAASVWHEDMRKQARTHAHTHALQRVGQQKKH